MSTDTVKWVALISWLAAFLVWLYVSDEWAVGLALWATVATVAFVSRWRADQREALIADIAKSVGEGSGESV